MLSVKRVAFVTAAPTARALTTTSWICGRPCQLRSSGLPVTGSARRSFALTVVRCAADSPAKDEEEDALDEDAMRAAEIHEVLTGLKDFKARIVDDATKLAKKVRASKKDLEKSLEAHPDLIKIEGHVRDLEEELKQLGDR